MESDEGRDLQASVEEIALWAKVSSSGAFDNVFEWTAFGLAAAAAYLLFMPHPKAFGLPEIVIIYLFFIGYMMVVYFELTVALALRDLCRRLQHWMRE
jgi:hypothetical protein